MAGIKGFQDYECVRRYLEHIYLYGFFGREDFNSVTGGSAKDYDRVLPLLKALFPEEQRSGLGGFNYKRIRRQYEASGENRMAHSYMLHSINVESHLLWYLKLLSALRVRERNLMDLDHQIWDLTEAMGQWNDTYRKTYDRVTELAEHGYIQKIQAGRYRLEKLTLSREALTQLYSYVRFASEITYPRVPGSFLRRTLEREMYRHGIKPSAVSPILLRHNTSHNVFDEEVVFQLLEAIRQHCWILIDGRRYLPIQLRPECRYGRWYVVLVELYQDLPSPSIRQLSRIKRVDVLEAAEDDIWDQAIKTAQTAFQNSMYSGQKSEEAVLVEVELLFGDAKGLENQFIREIRIGQVTREKERTLYRVRINDPSELLPLLRSYSPWLRVLPGAHDLDERLRSTLREMDAALNQGVWTSPSRVKRSQVEQNKSGRKRSNLKMLNYFQSRQMQFALELCARMEGFGGVTAAEIQSIAVDKYGLQIYDDLLNSLVTGHLIKKEGEYYLLDCVPAPVLPASQIEREYLQYILTLPEAELFLSEQTRQELTGEQPWWAEHIRRFDPAGMALPRNPGPEGFRLLLEAIQSQRQLHYYYRTNGSSEWKEAQSCPWKLEYSAYDRRWWVIFYSEQEKQKRTVKVPLNHLRELRMGGKSAATDEDILAAMDTLRRKEPVELRITDSHNALQRCFLTFENQEIRESRRIEENGQIHYYLSFDWFNFDEEEILRRLLHLGPNVALLGPEPLRKKLILQVKHALDQNRETADTAQ